MKPISKGSGLNRISIEIPDTEEEGHIMQKDITLSSELEKSTMEKIGNKRRLLEKYLTMMYTLVNKLGYNDMKAWEEDILTVSDIGVEMGDVNTTTFLENLMSVIGAIPESASLITVLDYITEVNHLRESTSSGPSIVTPAMVKTESLNPELREISYSPRAVLQQKRDGRRHP